MCAWVDFFTCSPWLSSDCCFILFQEQLSCLAGFLFMTQCMVSEERSTSLSKWTFSQTSIDSVSHLVESSSSLVSSVKVVIWEDYFLLILFYFHLFEMLVTPYVGLKFSCISQSTSALRIISVGDLLCCICYLVGNIPYQLVKLFIITFISAN